MTAEEEEVSWSDSKGISHEHSRVEGKGTSHGTGNGLWILLQVIDGSDRDTEVGYRSPEVGCEEIPVEDRLVPDMMDPDRGVAVGVYNVLEVLLVEECSGKLLRDLLRGYTVGLLRHCGD